MLDLLQYKPGDELKLYLENESYGGTVDYTTFDRISIKNTVDLNDPGTILGYRHFLKKELVAITFGDESAPIREASIEKLTNQMQNTTVECISHTETAECDSKIETDDEDSTKTSQNIKTTIQYTNEELEITNRIRQLNDKHSYLHKLDDQFEKVIEIFDTCLEIVVIPMKLSDKFSVVAILANNHCYILNTQLLEHPGLNRILRSGLPQLIMHNSTQFRESYGIVDCCIDTMSCFINRREKKKSFYSIKECLDEYANLPPDFFESIVMTCEDEDNISSDNMRIIAQQCLLLMQLYTYLIKDVKSKFTNFQEKYYSMLTDLDDLEASQSLNSSKEHLKQLNQDMRSD